MAACFIYARTGGAVGNRKNGPWQNCGRKEPLYATSQLMSNSNHQTHSLAGV